MVHESRQYPPARFRDRTDAGKKLGHRLQELELQNVVVLAIPAGGVPVGKEVARILKAPLELMIARKIKFPWTTEAGFGAVAADGTVYLGPYAEGLPPEVVQRQIRQAQEEVEQRKMAFLQGRRESDLRGRAVILVDDGLAAGSTMLVAVRVVRNKLPEKIIVAVPTASGSAVKLIKPHVAQLLALYVHPEHLPFAVASSYENWYDLSDEDVKMYLGDSAVL